MNYVMKNKNKILIILLSVLAIAIMFNKGKSISDGDSFKLVKTDTIKESKICTSTDVELILRSDDNLLKDRDFIVLDLSTFELFKTKRIDKNRVGYYYRRTGKVKEFYTVFKNESIATKKNTLNK